jgi:hypothetical protein
VSWNWSGVNLIERISVPNAIPWVAMSGRESAAKLPSARLKHPVGEAYGEVRSTPVSRVASRSSRLAKTQSYQ